MYDILQLNDMLVPELHDLAEQLSIPDAKHLNKQDLIYKILDKQALSPNGNETNGAEKPKRKRTIKASTANSTEEAEVMTEAPKAERVRKEHKVVAKNNDSSDEEKPKRVRPKIKKEEPVTENENETVKKIQMLQLQFMFYLFI
jgi:transcription termination factor Rho